MAKARDTDIPVEILRERLSYDPQTGVLTWLEGKRRGKVAGSKHHTGYLVLEIVFEGQRRQILGHRAAFAVFWGCWPQAELDHRNGDRADNSIGNLREATAADNAQNRKKRPSRAGLRGVAWRSDLQKWAASIGVNGKRRALGHFTDAGEAHKAYLAARQALFTFQPEPRQ